MTAIFGRRVATGLTSGLATSLATMTAMGLRAPAIGFLGALMVVVSGFAGGVLWSGATGPLSSRETASGVVAGGDQDVLSDVAGSPVAVASQAADGPVAPSTEDRRPGAAPAEEIFAFVARALSAEQVDGRLSPDRVMAMLDAALSSIDVYGGVIGPDMMKSFFGGGSGGAAGGGDGGGGQRGGLGLGVFFLRGATPPAVSGVAPGSAAEAAGIRPGDRIVSIDGRAVVSEADVVDRIAAKISAAQDASAQRDAVKGVAAGENPAQTPGSALQPPPWNLPVVSLGVSRAGADMTVEVRLARWRDVAAFVSVVDGDAALIRMRSFLPGAAEDLARAQAQAALFIGRSPSGIILDLRGNGGGAIEEALLSATLFLEPGAPFHTRLAGSGAASAPGGVVAVPRVEGVEPFSGQLAVLIDDQTASAAEMLASALRAGRGAPLIGRKTRGKGSIQRIMEIPGADYGVRFTVSHYLGAAGEIIDGVGLEPDVAVAPHLADQVALKWLSELQ